MSDIVERLRNWRTVHLTQLRYLLESAADEIERLRLSARADFPEPENATNEGKVFSPQNMTLLTSEERDVLREVCRVYSDEDDVGCNEIAYVIDRILERLGGAANSTPIHRNDCGESRTGSDDEAAGEEAAKCTVPSEKCPERERVNNNPATPDSLTLTDAEREAVAWTIDLGEGNVYDIQNFQWEAEAIADALLKNEGVIAKAVPLYRHTQPTLTDEDREAVEYFAAFHRSPREADANAAATLRSLLERLGGAM